MQAFKVAALIAACGLALSCGDPAERAAQLRERAKRHLENDQWSEARGELLALVQVAPDDSAAHYDLARVQFRLREHGGGLEALREAVRLEPGNGSWRLELAQALLDRGALSEARTHADTLLAAQPDNVAGLLVRADLASAADELHTARLDLEAVLALEPENTTALDAKARALVRSGDFDAAEAVLVRLLEVAPTAANHMSLARLLSARGRLKEAATVSHRAIDVARNQGERVAAHLSFANLYLDRGDRETARRMLVAAHKRDPEAGPIVLALARLMRVLGDPRQAETLLLKHADCTPDCQEPLLVLAAYYADSGQRDRALAIIEQARARDPDWEAARIFHARLLYLGPDADEALRARVREELRAVLDRNPKNVDAHLAVAEGRLADGEYEVAATILRRALDVNASSSGHFLLGTAYQRLDRPEQARREFQRALQLDPQNTEARISFAALCLRAGDHETARREAALAIQERPQDPRSRLVLARALMGLERPEDALDALEAIGEGSGLESADRMELARLLDRTGKREAARSILAGLVNRDEVRDTARAELTEITLRDERPLDAIAYLDSWLAQEPDSAQLYLLRGRAFLAIESDGDPVARRPEAESDLRTAIDLGLPGIDAHLVLASLYAQTGRAEQALELMTSAQAIAPLDTRVPLWLARIYEKLGGAEEARAAYENALRLAPDEPVVMTNLAWLLADGDKPTEADLERATELAQRAIQRLPDDPRVADTLGWIMLQRHDTLAAASLFLHALKALPEGHALNGRVRYHLALAHEKRGEFERAAFEADRALAMLDVGTDPEVAELHLLRARAHMGMAPEGDVSSAPEVEADLIQAIESGLPGVRAHMLLSDLYLRTGVVERALQVLDAARERAPRNPHVAYELGAIHESLGRQSDAREAYAHVLLLSGHHRFIFDNLAWLLSRTGTQIPSDASRAAALVDSARGVLRDDPIVADALGWFILEKHVHAAAIALFSEALTSLTDPGARRATARYHLALALQRSGDIEGAIAESTGALVDASNAVQREALERLLTALRSP